MYFKSLVKMFLTGINMKIVRWLNTFRSSVKKITIKKIAHHNIN